MNELFDTAQYTGRHKRIIPMPQTPIDRTHRTPKQRLNADLLRAYRAYHVTRLTGLPQPTYYVFTKQVWYDVRDDDGNKTGVRDYYSVLYRPYSAACLASRFLEHALGIIGRTVVIKLEDAA